MKKARFATRELELMRPGVRWPNLLHIMVFGQKDIDKPPKNERFEAFARHRTPEQVERWSRSIDKSYDAELAGC